MVAPYRLGGAALSWTQQPRMQCAANTECDWPAETRFRKWCELHLPTENPPHDNLHLRYTVASSCHTTLFMAGRRVVVFPSSAELGPVLAQLVTSRAERAIASRGRFTLGLSGGSLVSMLSKELLALPALDCSKWAAGFCDERLVSFDDPESTYGLYKAQFFSKVNIPDSGVLKIDPSLPVNECAEDYTRKLKEAFPGDDFPVFDLLLLGMGPDGHTCSLFPDHPLLEETEKIVAPISDSPKPPPQRVTMTFPVVNSARCVAFVSTGGSKAPVLKEVLEGREGPALPAARVVPTNGELFWLVDDPAAASLTIQVERPGSGAKL